VSAAVSFPSAAKASAQPLLRVEGLKTHFFTRAGVVKAVDGVSFAVETGRVLGLVGESGSGKSVTGYSILGLVDPPGRVVEGSVSFEGRNLVTLPPDEMRKIRGRRISMVFQDPTATLNPVLSVGDQMGLAIAAHERLSGRAEKALMIETLGKVGIPTPPRASQPIRISSPAACASVWRLPSRSCIAGSHHRGRADHSARRVGAGADHHEMRELVRRSDTAMIWITHDLATVSSLADHIMVMYAGKMVEAGPTAGDPQGPAPSLHPRPLDSVPSRNPRGVDLPQIPGSTPSLLKLGQGCAFAPRCAFATAACTTAPETLVEGQRSLRCHNPAGLAA
jgi:peptide/nickel transport system ATP-binding protein